MGMFGARAAAPASADPSWLFPASSRPTPLPTGMSWLFPEGVPQTDNGPDPFGYNPPFVPPETLPTKPQTSALNQRCLDALHLVRKTPEDVARVAALMPTLRPAATAHMIDPNMLAAVALRESGGKNIAEIGGGDGMGVFQLTNRPHVTAAQAYSVPFAANYAAGMIQNAKAPLPRKYPNFTPEQLNQAAAAIYNKGYTKHPITTDPASIDIGTARPAYGKSVVDLMYCFPQSR